MNQNRSVAMIDAPEFINLQPDALNPGISQCEIKVFYLGQNRNHSYIDRNTAIQMANSLPGTPIVGAFRKDIEDFGDHGEIMHIEDGELTFSCKTVPYGFVAPDAEVWFKKFKDTDEFGNEVEREYLMTTGYLWTGQYPEVMQCITEGKGQSMELDGESMDGHWATDSNTGIDFFIINDAIFTKLCILGDDVEPCFEGASVTSPDVSKDFSLNCKTNFSKSLFSMMNELKFALQNKGGSDMPAELEEQQEQIEEAVETVVEAEVEETEVETTEEVAESADDAAEESEDSDDSEDAEFACGSGKKKKYEDGEDKDREEQSEEADGKDASNDESKKKPTKNALEEVAALESQLASMQEELDALREFKLEQENLKKDALINKYHMLSDEDKADVIAHKSEYTYDEIEAKLAVMYVKKNVDFSAEDKQESVDRDEAPVVSFSLDNQSAGFVPPMVESLRQAKQSLF